ncbi:MAG: blue (type 1) copper domain protein [Actinomycetia bacterium]|nr:blue (type 1) copper domain protein [Actinomycetes bacterium]
MLRSLLSTRLACAVVLVAATSAVAGPALASRAHTTATVTVTGTEFKFAFSPASVKAGSVTFNFMNKGKVMHDFQIAGKKTPVIGPGKSAKLTVTLKKGTKYPYKCTVDAHAAAGMQGTLTPK